MMVMMMMVMIINHQMMTMTMMLKPTTLIIQELFKANGMVTNVQGASTRDDLEMLMVSTWHDWSIFSWWKMILWWFPLLPQLSFQQIEVEMHRKYEMLNQEADPPHHHFNHKAPASLWPADPVSSMDNGSSEYISRFSPSAIRSEGKLIFHPFPYLISPPDQIIFHVTK